MSKSAAVNPASSPAVESRLAPVGKALALLGIGAEELGGRKFTVDGRRVQMLRFGRLALAVSYVDRAEYGTAALAERRDDAKWVAIEARAHEHAIERASALGAIVPVRLLTIFDDFECLQAAARTNLARWSRSLARLGQKREFVLRAYRGPHALPSVMQPYLIRTAARAVRASRVPAYSGDAAVAAELEAWWATSARMALGTRRIDAPAERGELFSGVVLARADAREALMKIGDERAAATLGITYYIEGPRAPFSFV